MKNNNPARRKLRKLKQCCKLRSGLNGEIWIAVRDFVIKIIFFKNLVFISTKLLKYSFSNNETCNWTFELKSDSRVSIRDFSPGEFSRIPQIRLDFIWKKKQDGTGLEISSRFKTLVWRVVGLFKKKGFTDLYTCS